MPQEWVWGILLGTVWAWSALSATVIRLVMARNISALPLWAVKPRGTLALSALNLLLAVASLGLPMAPFLILPLGTALRVILFGFGIGAGLVIVLTIATKNLMLRYFATGVLAVAAIAMAL